MKPTGNIINVKYQLFTLCFLLSACVVSSRQDQTNSAGSDGGDGAFSRGAVSGPTGAGSTTGGNSEFPTTPGAEGTTGGTTGSSSGSTTGASSLWVMGYHVGYQNSLLAASDIDFDGLTHLVVGRALPQANGDLATHFDIDNSNGPIFADNAVTAAHAHGKKAILMVGGAGEYANFVSAGSTTQTRQALAQSIITFAKAHDFDGVDIDWEPIQPADEEPVLALLDDLRAGWPDALITIPVMWFNANLGGARSFYGDLAERVDQMNIMSYEMAGTYEGWNSWHSSALDGEGGNYPTSIQYSVDTYRSAGVPASKLGLGIGFYGLCYSGSVTAPRQALSGSTIVASDNTMSYSRIMDAYFTAEDDHFDNSAKVPYLSFDSVKTGPGNATGCRYISYDDERSIEAKAAFVKANGLGGAIIWTVAQGYRSSQAAGLRHPLLQATRTHFLE